MLLELEGKPLLARENKFISLSRDSDSGGQDNFGMKEIAIEFDENKIFQQGAEEIWYEEDYFNENPKISLYVTGYKNENDYYYQNDYSGPEEANQNYDLTWDQVIDSYTHEEEILMKKIYYEKGLINNVIFYSDINPVLKDMLDEFRISYNFKK
jgi:hypothetical protein